MAKIAQQIFCERCGEFYAGSKHKCTPRPGHPRKRPTEKKTNVTMALTPENKQYLIELAQGWGVTLSEAGNRLIEAHRVAGLRVEKREQALKEWERGQ